MRQIMALNPNYQIKLLNFENSARSRCRSSPGAAVFQFFHFSLDSVAHAIVSLLAAQSTNQKRLSRSLGHCPQ